MRHIASFALIVLFAFQCVRSYKILGLFPTTSASHYYVGNALMKGLAAAGHDVTIFSPFNESKPIKNYRGVYLSRIRESEF